VRERGKTAGSLAVAVLVDGGGRQQMERMQALSRASLRKSTTRIHERTLAPLVPAAAVRAPGTEAPPRLRRLPLFFENGGVVE